MSEQPKEDEPFVPVTDPRFANETPAERKARVERLMRTIRSFREHPIKLDIDIDELRGRKRS